ncbi:TPA: translation initiation factor IF-3 [Patescibacteria group bacterium]|nr:translation initiation factor IF-3 [Patescibacteria group bacterium]
MVGSIYTSSMSPQLRLRINEQIRLPQVFLIDENGQRVGAITTSEALTRAKAAGLDLVEVVPNQRPPVCKIIDYGKFQYEQEKSDAQQRKRQKNREEKEMRLSLGIDDHDLLIKAKKVDQFLAKQHKVKIVVRFKGRQITHPELGKQTLDKFLGMLQQRYSLEKTPLIQNRQLFTVLNPK